MTDTPLLSLLVAKLNEATLTTEDLQRATNVQIIRVEGNPAVGVHLKLPFHVALGLGLVRHRASILLRLGRGEDHAIRQRILEHGDGASGKHARRRLGSRRGQRRAVVSRRNPTARPSPRIVGTDAEGEAEHDGGRYQQWV